MNQQKLNSEQLTLSSEEHELVRDALDRIQQAQNLINEAAQSLCSVRGFANEWSDSIHVHDTIKTYWHQVETRRRGQSYAHRGK